MRSQRSLGTRGRGRRGIVLGAGRARAGRSRGRNHQQRHRRRSLERPGHLARQGRAAGGRRRDHSKDDVVVFDRNDDGKTTCQKLYLDPRGVLKFKTGRARSSSSSPAPIESYGPIKLDGTNADDHHELRLTGKKPEERTVKFAKGGARSPPASRDCEEKKRNVVARRDRPDPKAATSFALIEAGTAPARRAACPAGGRAAQGRRDRQHRREAQRAGQPRRQLLSRPVQHPPLRLRYAARRRQRPGVPWRPLATAGRITSTAARWPRSRTTSSRDRITTPLASTLARTAW